MKGCPFACCLSRFLHKLNLPDRFYLPPVLHYSLSLEVGHCIDKRVLTHSLSLYSDMFSCSSTLTPRLFMSYLGCDNPMAIPICPLCGPSLSSEMCFGMSNSEHAKSTKSQASWQFWLNRGMALYHTAHMSPYFYCVFLPKQQIVYVLTPVSISVVCILQGGNPDGTVHEEAHRRLCLTMKCTVTRTCAFRLFSHFRIYTPESQVLESLHFSGLCSHFSNFTIRYSTFLVQGPHC